MLVRLVELREHGSVETEVEMPSVPRKEDFVVGTDGVRRRVGQVVWRRCDGDWLVTVWFGPSRV